MSELVWQYLKVDALALAKEQKRMILLLGGKDECSVCAGMKEIIAASPIRELVDKCFVPWYGKIVMHSSEWSSCVSGTYALPFIAVIDPNKPDECKDKSFGRQDQTVLYSRLLNSCEVIDPYADLDVDLLYTHFKAGVEDIMKSGEPLPWCGGIISSHSTAFGAFVRFTDDATKAVVRGLENFTADDLLKKLYDVFPNVKAELDLRYCKSCTETEEPCTEPECLLADIKMLGDEKLKAILNKIVCKVWGTCSE